MSPQPRKIAVARGNGLTAYGQSKLACLMFGDELDRRLRATERKIKSVTAHPGGSDSGLFDEMSRWQYYSFQAFTLEGGL